MLTVAVMLVLSICDAAEVKRRYAEITEIRFALALDDCDLSTSSFNLSQPLFRRPAETGKLSYWV